MFKVLRRTVYALMLFFVASSAMCQVATGTYPYGTFDTLGFDTVNVGNLNVNFNIQVLNRAGRGLPFYYLLGYNSSVWVPTTVSGVTSWTPAQNFGWRGETEVVTGYMTFGSDTSTISTGSEHSENCTITTHFDFVYHDPFGVAHPFPSVGTQQDSGGSSSCGTSETTSTGVANDGSGYTLNVTNFTTSTVSSRQGKSVAVPNINNGSATVTDANGNQISVNGSGGFIDTTGNTVLTVAGTGTPTSPQTFSYKDATGTSREVTMNYTAYTVQTHFGVSGITEYGPVNTALVSSIDFPDGSSYSFTYEATPAAGECTPISGTSTASCVTGRISSVTLPAGGTITYAYTGGSNGIESDGSTAGLTRTLTSSASSAASTWAYTRTSGTGTSTTAVVDGLGNHKVYTFVEASNQPTGTTAAYYETSRNVYQGATTTTAVIARNTCYNAAASPCGTASFTLPISQIDTYESLNGSGIHGTTAAYNAFGLQTLAEVFDFGSSTARGSLLRKEVWTYGGSIPSLVTQDEVFDGSGNLAGETLYGYDGAAPTVSSGVPQHVTVSGPRGNLTSMTQFASTGTSYASSATYEDTGSLLTSTTPNGKTTLSYDSTFTYNTGATLPTPSSGVSIGTSASFDTTNTGLPLSSTDPNSQETKITTYDSMLRPTEIEYPDGGETTWTYTPTLVTTATLQTPNPSASNEIQYDGYGRPSRSEVANGQSGNDFYQTDTCYDGNGNVAFSSYRYQSTGFGATKVCSGSGGDTNTYDVLGRLINVTRGNGETRTYMYKGRATQFTDENGVSRISQVDGLGRLTTVCEIAPTTINTQNTGTPANCGTDIAGTGLITTYSYTLATPTTTITQGTQTTQGIQIRTFQSDWLGRPTMVSEPESGTTTYSYAYNSTGLQTTRQRPKANQSSSSTLTTTTWQYDSLSRLVSVSYTDGTPTKTYTYDVNGGFGDTQTNIIGRLSHAATPTTGTVYGYDAMGRIVFMAECVPTTCGNGAFGLNYTYDLAGNLTSSSDGSGVTTTYTLSPAAEVLSIKSSLSDSTHPGTLVSNVLNGPNGPVSYTLGNGLSQFNSYDGLGRVNGGSVCPEAPSSNCTSAVYSFSVNRKGTQLTGSSDSVQGAGITYGYDNFNRLTSLTNSVGLLYSYTYDRYGNRWAQTQSQGGVSFSQSFNKATNQIIGTGFTYDAAGNLTSDTTNTYTYDADGNLIQQVGGGTTQGFTYDALNQQVAQSFPIGSSQLVTEVAFDKSGQLASLWLVGSGNALSQRAGKAYWGTTAIESYAPQNNMAYFAHRDWVGSRRAITDATGATSDIRQSLPFGDGAANVSGSQDNTFDGFTGMWNGGTSATNHAQFREYWNSAGRWLQPDPYSGSYRFKNPQSFNRYAYALNNPLGLIDPLGLDVICYDTPDSSWADGDGTVGVNAGGEYCDSDGSSGGGGGVSGGGGGGGGGGSTSSAPNSGTSTCTVGVGRTTGVAPGQAPGPPGSVAIDPVALGLPFGTTFAENSPTVGLLKSYGSQITLSFSPAPNLPQGFPTTYTVLGAVGPASARIGGANFNGLFDFDFFGLPSLAAANAATSNAGVPVAVTVTYPSSLPIFCSGQTIDSPIQSPLPTPPGPVSAVKRR